MFTFLIVLLAATAVITLLIIGLRGFVGAMVFHPGKSIAATPAAFDLPYEEVRISTSDGESLGAWFIPGPKGQNPGSGLTLLFFHGNAGNISHRLDSVAVFHQLGLDVLIVDYRGYGQSTGRPSVDGTLLDAEAAWEWLRLHKGLTPDRLVLFGRSLGGGPASYLAARLKPRGLILESTFTSLHDVAKDMFPEFLVSLLLRQDYDVRARLSGLRLPLLVAHSPDDETVPYALGRELYENYAGSKSFLALRGSHNTGYRTDREMYIRGLASFLESLEAASE